MSVNLPPLRPVLNFDPELLLRAQPVRVVFFDVDGVLTDGGLYFGESGEALKRFHTLDGHGIKLLQRAGITPAVVTGRDSPALRLRPAMLQHQWLQPDVLELSFALPPGSPRNTTKPPALLTSEIIARSDCGGIDVLAKAMKRGAPSKPPSAIRPASATILSKSNAMSGDAGTAALAFAAYWRPLLLAWASRCLASLCSCSLFLRALSANASASLVCSRARARMASRSSPGSSDWAAAPHIAALTENKAITER